MYRKWDEEEKSRLRKRDEERIYLSEILRKDKKKIKFKSHRGRIPRKIDAGRSWALDVLHTSINR